MAFWIKVTPEVLVGLQSFGFDESVTNDLRQFVEAYLSLHGEQCFKDRWDRCPDDFFIYTHLLVAAGRLHTLEFVVDDSSAAAGVLNIVWVEHHRGKLLTPPPADPE